MSDKTPKDISAALAVPFPKEALKWRWADRAQTRRLDYVQGHTVIHRLNDATGNRWDFTVDKVERTQIDAENTMLMAYVTLEIPGLGRRQHIGVQAVNARGGEDLVKGAVTDALKKAATLFGVGLELYGPDYEAGEIANEPSAPARARTATVTAMPAAPPGDAPEIGDWTDFWNAVVAMGLPRGKDELKKVIGKDVLTYDAQYSFEQVQAWHHDNAVQKAVV